MPSCQIEKRILKKSIHRNKAVESNFIKIINNYNFRIASNINI